MAHKDLSHLTEEQIKDLIKRYYSFDKVSDLLEEFNINVHSSRLVKLFPDVIHDKLFCKYCLDVNLVSKLESRSFSNMDDFIPFSAFCPACNHNDNKYCSCHNCREAVKQYRQTEEEGKRNVLKQTFLRTDIEIPTVKDLTLKDALYLLSVVEHSATKDLEFIKPYLEGRSITSLAPEEELRCDIIEHLNRKGFIQINPLASGLDAFIFDQEKILT